MIVLICICLLCGALGIILGYVCSLQDKKINSLLKENEKLAQKCKQLTDESYRMIGMIQNLQRQTIDK